MTKVVSSRILKDVNGTINDHIHNHTHLMNCVHLKNNHMHKQSPNLVKRSLMRDFAALQRSRSLKDPSASPPSEQRYRGVKQSRQHVQDDLVKTLSEKLEGFHLDSDDGDSSQVHVHGRFSHDKRVPKKGKTSVRRVKKRSVRGARRSLAFVASRDVVGENEMSVASNSFGRGASNQRYHLEQGDEEYREQNVTMAPRNGFGVPCNWSRIHHRSMHYGLSGSRLKNVSGAPRVRNSENIHEMSEYSTSSSKSSEAFPLLLDPFGSQESAGNEIDSDLASEARFGGQCSFHGHRSTTHKSLTQKYKPRTFRDLVGQNLVAKALSNAVVKKRVGLLYVFYGPNGTGKTSCARVFAKALNCQSREHLKPCGVCNSCVSHDMGNNRNIREIGPVSNFDFDNLIISKFSSRHKVFIFDDCDNLHPDRWSVILKVTDRAPRRVVFILVCSSLDALPHVIVSRCQKFFFPKLKDADIIYTLQRIATKEGLEIDKDSLKLIAARSDGSLRDAEMTLEQLSLLGQRISVSLVQEMVGLISDEKLVDLLDLALSADMVNTVKSLREIMESGVEPLALMSQLATVITDILAGSYDLTKKMPRRKFFRHQALTKDDMEKLRQALKTLSEAEKQLRVSNDPMTWLTAALLQLAPDQQYQLPSSTDTSCSRSPLVLNNGVGREILGTSDDGNAEIPYRTRQLSTTGRTYRNSGNKKKRIIDRNGHSGDRNRVSSRQEPGKVQSEIEDIWTAVLKKIHITNLREFLHREGKLTSVRHGTAPMVHLVFSSHATKSKAEKYRVHISQAFESVLGSPVTIEIRCESRKDSMAGNADVNRKLPREREGGLTEFDSAGLGKHEIVELETDSVAKNSNAPSVSGVRKLGNRNPNLSLVRRKVSLAQVLQRGVGHTQQSGWSHRKAVSIAEQIEQENLRLEPRSKSLLCWKTTRASRRKISSLKTKNRRPKALLKLMSCGKCLSDRTSR